MAQLLNQSLRRGLSLYDAYPFVCAMVASNLLIFILFSDWVMTNPLLAVPLLAFLALWFSLITGSLFEILRQYVIAYLHQQGQVTPQDS